MRPGHTGATDGAAIAGAADRGLRSIEVCLARRAGDASHGCTWDLRIAVVVCGTAFAVEILRALGGNTLSWAYVFEWPILLAYGVYMWQRLVREERGASRAATAGPRSPTPTRTPRSRLGTGTSPSSTPRTPRRKGRQPRGRPSATDEEPAGRTSDGSTAASTPFTNLGDASVE